MIFTVERKLRFGDCDPSGIAYFPSYLNLLVGVTEDLFAEAGWDWAKLAREHDIATPTVRLDLTFARPGYQGDLLTFACRIIAIGRSSLDLDHAVSSGERLWGGRQRIVATRIARRRACAWPEEVRAALAEHLETQDA